MSGKKNRALHREIGRAIEPTENVGEYRWKRSDPSLGDQAVGKMMGMDLPTRHAMLMKMLQQAPNSTAGTRAKWRRRLHLS